MKLYLKALLSILILLLLLISALLAIWLGIHAAPHFSASGDLDFSRLDLLIVCIASTTATFGVLRRFLKRGGTEFNIVNRVLYRLCLGNPIQYNAAIKKINRGDTKNQKRPKIVFITGLARAGTTTLLQNMHKQ